VFALNASGRTQGSPLRKNMLIKNWDGIPTGTEASPTGFTSFHKNLFWILKGVWTGLAVYATRPFFAGDGGIFSTAKFSVPHPNILELHPCSRHRTAQQIVRRSMSKMRQHVETHFPHQIVLNVATKTNHQDEYVGIYWQDEHRHGRRKIVRHRICHKPLHDRLQLPSGEYFSLTNFETKASFLSSSLSHNLSILQGILY